MIAASLLTLEYGVAGAGVARSWSQKIEDWLREGDPDGDYHWLNKEYANLLAALITALCVTALLCGVRCGELFVNTITAIKVGIVLFIIVLIAILAQPRLNYALACDGLLPPIFAKVDANGNMFANTLFTDIFLTLVSLFMPFSTLWEVVNLGVLLAFSMSNVSLLMVRMRKESPSSHPSSLPRSSCVQFSRPSSTSRASLTTALACVSCFPSSS